jgi:hypothetical protein
MDFELKNLVFMLLTASLTRTKDNSTAVEDEKDNTIRAGLWLTTGDALNKLEQQDRLAFSAAFSAALANSSAYAIFNSARKDELHSGVLSLPF